MKHDSASTLISRSELLTGATATIPTFTILWHPDQRRVGDRSALSTLLLGHPAFLSREQPEFSAVGSRTGQGLNDVHVSRTPIRCLATRDGGIELDGFGPGARLDGGDVNGRAVVSRGDLVRGVMLELGGRILLFLHLVVHYDHSIAGDMVGQSDAIERVRREVLRVADLDTPVLVRGETGAGKELVAEAIHRHGRRARAAYVAVNMASLAESVVASALFGHAKGAFTGAQQRHRGLFKRASGGTLLLDELGETPRSVQPVLLRAVETGRILPLGDEAERTVDVRLVAATDADLEAGIEAESFSAALLHRLTGYEIHVPPLRERREDIPLLFMHFLRREIEGLGTAVAGPNFIVPAAFIARLIRHPWPGNVRQLRNFARHFAIANRGSSTVSLTPAIERELEAPRRNPGVDPRAETRPRKATDITQDELLSTLRENGWSPGRTAEHLGIPTGTLHSLMRRCVVRRAADIDDGELRAAYEASGGNVEAMAGELQVSVRGLRITLSQRKISNSESA